MENDDYKGGQCRGGDQVSDMWVGRVVQSTVPHTCVNREHPRRGLVMVPILIEVAQLTKRRGGERSSPIVGERPAKGG